MPLQILPGLVRQFYLCLFLLFAALPVIAQWKTVPVQYNQIKRPDFFIPLAMHFSDTANGYILTTGSLLQLQDNRWMPVNTGDTGYTGAFFYSNVFTVNSHHTFLCGYDGKVAKFNGDSLAVMFAVSDTETVNPALNTIFMIDSLHGWAAGESGTLLKIDSNTYTMHNLQPMYSFRDMYFDSPDHGWMIGYSQEHMEDGGIIFEYVNGVWDNHSAVDGKVLDIEFSSPGHGFVSTTADIYRYNPQTDEWEREFVPDYYPQLHLSLLNDEYGISVSDNYQNMLYNDGEWIQGPSANVQDISWVQSTGYGTAWGLSQIGHNNPQDLNEGKIQLLNENEWSPFSIKYLDSVKTMPLDIAVTSILATDRKNVWIDGGRIRLPTDKNWPDSAPVLGSDTFCTALKLFSEDFGLALNGDVLEWNGQHWLNKNIDPVTNPDTSIANVCMHVFSDTTGFIGRQLFAWSSGEINSVICHYDYKTNAVAVSSYIGSRYPSSIHFSDKENGWCVGDSGLVVRYAGGQWNVQPSFTEKRLNGVFATDASTAWAIGEEGLLFKYDGNTWIQHLLPTQQSLRSIHFTDASHGWVAGDSGLIFRYNGAGWTQDSTGTTEPLYAIFMVDSAYGFAGGNNGLFLQYTPPPPPAPDVRQFCELGNSWFVFYAGDSNYTYQWQADTGNGFENLAENDTYSGVYNDTLWLSSMPPSFYGYRYRCVATFNGTDTISEPEELKFVNRWTGAVTDEWENPGNWSCGSLPGENTDVLIESGRIILRSPVNVRSLTAQPGVHIIIENTGTLNILK